MSGHISYYTSSSFTSEFLAGMLVELIMKISRHKRTNDFYKYIPITPEEAAREIKELWWARNDMKLIKDTVAELKLQYNEEVNHTRIIRYFRFYVREKVYLR